MIAIPLLEKIEEEAHVREELQRMIGTLTEPYNVALILEGEYPGGHAGLEQAVRRLFKELRERQKRCAKRRERRAPSRRRMSHR